MKLKKFMAVSAAALMLASSITACSGGSASQSASGDKVIKIGVFEPLTGENGAS